MRINFVLLSLLISIGLYAQKTGKFLDIYLTMIKETFLFQASRSLMLETKKSFTIYSMKMDIF